MADRKMYRYMVPIDAAPHVITLTGDPVAAAAIGAFYVEFWAEHDESAGKCDRAFQAFGTGHALPQDGRWAGTCLRTSDGLVWHLYEVKVPDA